MWLAKEYQYDMGCTAVKMSHSEAPSSKFWLFKWIQERLEKHRDPQEYYYYLYDPSGARFEVTINWKPELNIND